MKLAASICRQANQNDYHHKRLLCLHANSNSTVCRVFYLACLTITTLFFFHLLFSYYRSLNYIQEFNQTKKDVERERCNLFEGQWIRDLKRPLYTNYSCNLIPFARNCFLQGRKDRDFVHWRWKPEKCQLRRFNPERFFSGVRGKNMAFIGDSVARNQMQSLLCLLSTVESPAKSRENPRETVPDAQGRLASATFEFPKHNFTLMLLSSQFLVSAADVVVNGTATGGFHLHLDKPDTNWSEMLPSIDYAVFSDSNWFFRQNYLYEGGNLIGCVYCNSPNITDVGPGLAIRNAFRTAFKAVNECRNCRKILTLLRTYSPSHFENGAWNSGGACNRTWPIEVSKGGPDLDYRKIQLEEMEIARKAGGGRGNKFEVIDVTEMMLSRADGHPGVYQGKAWMKGYSDCVHGTIFYSNSLRDNTIFTSFISNFSPPINPIGFNFIIFFFSVINY